MSAKGLILVLGVVALLAPGQLLFKWTAAQWRVDEGLWVGLRTLASPAFVAALVLYGLATLLWVYALRIVPLTAAFPLYALTFLVVPLIAHYFGGEPLTPNMLIGGVVIVVGVAIAAR